MAIEFSSPVRNHYFLLRCVPSSSPCQKVASSSLTVWPEAKLFSYTDSFANLCHQGSVLRPHMEFAIHMKATVESHYSDGLRGECSPLYKSETQLTKSSGQMLSFLDDVLRDFGGSSASCKIIAADTLSFAEFLSTRLFSHLEYIPGETTITTSAAQSFAMRRGVCQDYAHIFTSLCRKIGIAARYVCGTSTGEGATHAWVEVYVPSEGGGRWVGIDPTRNRLCDDGYVVLSRGRDFRDCQIDRGVLSGFAAQTMSVFVKTEQLGSGGEDGRADSECGACRRGEAFSL